MFDHFFRKTRVSRTDTVFLAVTQSNIPEDLQSAATSLQPPISQMLILVWRGNKMPTRCNRLVFLLENLLFAHHVSGTIMPIIRRSRFIQMVAACGTWRFDLQVVGLVWSCELCFRFAAQLLTRPTTCKPKHQVSQAATICIILDLLMMGIMVPEAC